MDKTYQRHQDYGPIGSVVKREVTVLCFSDGSLSAFENGKQIANIQSLNATDLIRDRIERMGYLVNRIEYQGSAANPT